MTFDDKYPTGVLVAALVWQHPIKAPYAALIGYFVQTFETNDGKPTFHQSILDTSALPSGCTMATMPYL